MKRITAGIIIGLGMFVLTSCGEADGGTRGHDLYEEHITIRDGSDVTCVVYDDGYNQGGVSCDFQDGASE